MTQQEQNAHNQCINELKELDNQLSLLNKGENAHIINKASFYLQSAISKNNSKTNLGKLVRAALEKNEWDEVDNYMRSWW